MRPAHYRPLLLMIHGVNSTLEWSEVARKVLEPHFHCRLVRYRYFHSLWGPIKVYAWPAALLFFVSCCLLGLPHWHAWWFGVEDTAWGWTVPIWRASWGHLTTLLVLLGVMLAEAYIVYTAESEWASRVESQPPILGPIALLTVVGLMGGLFLPHPLQWAFPIGATVGLAVFLDLREYNPVRLSLDALFLVPSLAASAAGLVILAAWHWESSRVLLVAAGVALGLGVLESLHRAKLAFVQVHGELMRARAEFARPFVVAHSLGTYLSGYVLRETAELRLGRVVFTGCVLHRAYPWEGVLAGGRARCVGVTNYVGQIDPVPLLTGLLSEAWYLASLGWLRGDLLARLTGWRRLGMAGFRGFRAAPKLVHTIDADHACAACRAEAVVAPVHNLDHAWASHSTLNNLPSFQSWSWLPLLWGIEPAEYEDWIDVCRLGFFHGQPELGSDGKPLAPLRPQNPDGFQHCASTLLSWRWSWPVVPEAPTALPGRTLEEYVRDIVGTMVPTPSVPPAELMARLPRFLFETVEAAVAEAGQAGGDAEILDHLHPQRALRHAVSLALAEA